MLEDKKLTTSGSDPLSRFKIIYTNLPIEERKLTVVVISDDPISWDMANREIINKTGLGDRILKKLLELKII